MASRAILSSVNYFTTGALSANSEVGNLAVTNLSNDHVSSSYGWQTPAGVVTFAGGAFVRCVFPRPAMTSRVVGVFGTNLTPAASVSFGLWNSAGPTGVWASVQAGPPSRYKQIVVVLPADTVADFVQITFDDPNNPDGFINIGGAWCGPAWNPQIGFSWSSAFGNDDVTSEIQARAGQEFPELLFERRRFEARFEGVTEPELWANLAEVSAAGRRGGNVLVVPDYASANINRESVLGRWRSAADVTFTQGSSEYRSYAARVTERL